MKILSITRDCLKCVADGVAVVEDGTQAAFAFILLNDLGLDLATASDNVSQLPGIQFEESR